LHYVPFWSMGRILYFHHYIPASILSSMLSAVILDYLIVSSRMMFPRSFMFVVLYVVGLLYTFYLFAPLVYGMGLILSPDANSKMYGLRWIGSWEF
jgi:dolichyl-phosphate-mannose-protein mannosyltransferase